jgi:hypothetical protein
MKDKPKDEAERREFATGMAMIAMRDRALYRQLRQQMWDGADLTKIGKSDLRN